MIAIGGEAIDMIERMKKALTIAIVTKPPSRRWSAPSPELHVIHRTPVSAT